MHHIIQVFHFDILIYFTSYCKNKNHGSTTNAHGPTNNAHGSINRAHGSTKNAHGSINRAHGSTNNAHGSINKPLGSTNWWPLLVVPPLMLMVP